MNNSTQFLVDITNFIVGNFKNHKIWDVEIFFQSLLRIVQTAFRNMDL